MTTSGTAPPPSRCMLVERGVLTQCRRDENAARSVELDIVGVPHQQALEIADAIVEARQRHQPGLDRLPFVQRVDQ